MIWPYQTLLLTFHSLCSGLMSPLPHIIIFLYVHNILVGFEELLLILRDSTQMVPYL